MYTVQFIYKKYYSRNQICCQKYITSDLRNLINFTYISTYIHYTMYIYLAHTAIVH